MSFIFRTRLLFLFLIAASQIFSPVLFVPGAEGLGGSAFRVLLLILGIWLIIENGFRPVSYPIRRLLITGGLLLAWMTISLTWSQDFLSGVRQVSYIGVIVILCYIIDLLIRDIKDFNFFAKVIFALGVAVTALSFYELITGYHFFVSSLEREAEINRSLSYITDDLAWFTFGNPNDLAVHIVFSCFVSLSYVKRSKISGFLSLIFIFVSFYISTLLGARLANLAIIAFALIYLISIMQARVILTANIAKIAITCGIIIILLALIMIDRAEFIDVSTFVRLQLVSSSLGMAMQTLLVGIGTGSFEAEMWLGGLIGRTYGIVNPHNAFGRILAENGILGLALFGFMVFGPLAILRRAARRTSMSSFASASTVALPLLLSAGSDPLSSSSLQLAIAFIWVSCRFAIECGGELQVTGFSQTPANAKQSRGS